MLAAALAVVSFLDDLLDPSYLIRLPVHLLAATAFFAFELETDHPLGFALLLAALALSVNLYNFMDGADGLAGGMGLFGFGAYELAAQLAGQGTLAGLSVAIVAACAVFLLRNFPLAKIFVGDVGTIPLGFLAGALGLAGWHDGIWPIWFLMLVFAPFVCDGTLTPLKRILRREKVWQAHRDHYYQRLVRMGFGHRSTAWIEYAATAACVATALLAREAQAEVQLAAVCGATPGLAAIALWIDARWARHLLESGGAAA